MSWTYDGWGNRLQQSAVKGSVPTMVSITDPATNRIQAHTYDANGNTVNTPQQGAMTYDVTNRLKTVAADTYGYDPSNKRIWKNDEYTFWGAAGERVGRYSAVKLVNDAGTHIFVFQKVQVDEYFGGRRLSSQDRLGSVGSYYPYGEAKSGTVSNADSFATYYRDSTGLDYADQRFYLGGSGRFLTSDPVEPGDVSNPQTRNFYAYVLSDPINFNDPEGLDVNVTLGQLPAGSGGVAIANQILAGTNYGVTAQGASNLFNSPEGILALAVFFETRPTGAVNEESGQYQSMLGVANVYANRYYSNWGGSRDRGAAGFKQAIMDASTPIFKRTNPSTGDYTSRDLYSSYQTTLNNILQGPANDTQGNCAGLIFSFQFAQNFVAHHFGLPYTPLPGMPVYNNVGDSLFFHSFNQKNPEKHTGWDGPLDYYKTFYTPKYGGGYAPFHFFTKRGVKINRPPGL